MPDVDPPNRSVVVIGGGISGLSAAHRLRELQPNLEVIVLEASDRLGGVLHTVRRDGFLVERGADNFITNLPWGLDLCRQLRVDDQLLTTNEERRKAFVVRQGRLHGVPAGFLLMVPERVWPVLTSGLLSPAGKLRLLGEYFVKARRDGADESLASFARRRLGREVFEQLVQPLIGGIYTADPEKLSLAATMPRFLEMERQDGGLLRARRRSREARDRDSSGARYSLFVTPRGGFSSLIDTLAAELPAGSIRLKTKADRLTRLPSGRWSVAWSTSQATGATIECDGVVVALPAPAASRLLADSAAELSAELGQIPYASAVVVSLGYRREQIRHPLDGFGFVVPANERRSILAASFSSVKFPSRAPDDSVLIRVFIGGACQPELARLPDDELQALAQRELGELLGASGAPSLVDVARWPDSMAQYHLGHLSRVERIESLERATPGLALAGNAYRGVGIAHCIHSGRLAAERVLAGG